MEATASLGHMEMNLMGIAMGMTIKQFFELMLDELDKNVDDASKIEGIPNLTEKVIADTIKFMEFLNNTETLSRIVGSDYLPKAKKIHDYYAELIKIDNAFKSIDDTDSVEVHQNES